MNNQSKKDRLPYKHYERPKTTRVAVGKNRERPSRHTSVWSGLIVAVIVIIALAPIVKSQFSGQDQKMVTSKPVKHKQSAVKKKSVKKVAKKSAKKTKVRMSSKSTQTSQQSQSKQSVVQNSSSTSEDTSQQTQNSQQQSQQSQSQSSQTIDPNTQAKTTGKYVVQAGDSLSAIASQFGLTVSDLTRLNNIKDTDQLMPGQELKLK